MSLTTVGVTLAILACRDLTSPLDPSGSARHFLNESGTVVVSPGAMHGWSFYNDQNDTACTDSTVCRMVDGPAGQPLGTGSAFLSTPAAGDGKALVLKDYAGTRFDAITELKYSTFRQSVDSGRNLAIALQVNADYDLSDQSVGYQGRLVYEPYQAAPGTVLDTTWQSWDARAGKWWGTKASVPRGDVFVVNPCVQATPCTWAQLLAAFPNVGIHATYGAVVLKAGSSWPGFRGNVDALSIGINDTTTTFDFELGGPAGVTLIPPDFFPKALFDSLGTVTSASSGSTFRKDIVTIDFRAGTPLAVRQAIIDSVGGVVVGGAHYEMAGEGTYYVRIRGGTMAALLDALAILHRQPQVIMAGWWELTHPDENAYRKPDDGFGFKDWVVDSMRLDPARMNWALEYVRAPLAWGCDVGSSSTSVAVVDDKVGYTKDISGNVYFGASRVLVTSFDSTVDYHTSPNADHGARVASVLAATGNDHQGMTGMAWHASLILRDRYALISDTGSVFTGDTKATSQLLVDHIVAAGLPRPGTLTEGASVINLSMEVKWPKGADLTDRERVERAELAHESVNNAIEQLAFQGRHPLVVIAAGNYAVPAELAGYAAAKIDHADQVLVVGGLDMTGGVWAQSNNGPNVDIYAPAVGVAQANGNNKIIRDEDGTSYAAPLAAGTAVLLKNFDPSLTAADMIRMIKQGGRSDAGTLKLDAYGALKKAAERSGAPLCGNRVYAKGADLIAQRDSSHTEVLGVMGTFPPGNGWINALHGGHRVNVYAWPNQWVFDHTPAGWTRTAVSEFSNASSENGGTFNGRSSRTHDGDTVFYARLRQNTVEIVVSDTITYAQQQIGSLQLPTPPNWSGDCDFEGYYVSDKQYQCRSFNYARGQRGTYGSLSSTVSPLDGSLYFSIGYLTESEVGGPAGWWTCGSVSDTVGGTVRSYDNHCRDTRTYDQSLDSLRIYRVVRSSGVPVYLASLIRHVPTTMAISEDGRELLFLSSRDTIGGRTYSWRTNAPLSQVQTVNPTYATCVTTAIPIVPTPQGPMLAASREIARETADRCQSQGSQFNVPTFAPVRTPIATSGLLPHAP